MPASVHYLIYLGVAESEEQGMNKKELLWAARILQKIQKRCSHAYWCDGCWAYKEGDCEAKIGNCVPARWNISDADIERLENEANLEKGIAAIERLTELPTEKII